MPTIEPNLHPVIVHYVIALLSVAPLLYLLAALGPQRLRKSAQAAGDWTLGLGVIAAAAAIAAGIYAANTVAHDDLAHRAMLNHRAWALATGGAFAAVALWRWLTRARAPTLVFALVAVLASGLLAATGYKGGALVYAHGLGVARLPELASEDGHDHGDAGHEHGPSDAAEAAASGSNALDAVVAAAAEPHEHADGAAAHDHGDEAAAAPESAVDPDSPAGAVAALHAALASGDADTVERLLDPDVVILEGGGSERSFAEYASHHLSADMAFLENIERSTSRTDAWSEGEVAWVVTEGRVSGTYEDREIDAATLETIILRRDARGWRIVHIHWS